MPKIYTLPIGPTAMIFKGVIIGPGNVTFDNHEDYVAAKARQAEVTQINESKQEIVDTGPQMHFGGTPQVSEPEPEPGTNGNGDEHEFTNEEKARITELSKESADVLKTRAEEYGVDTSAAKKKREVVEMIILAERNH